MISVAALLGHRPHVRAGRRGGAAGPRGRRTGHLRRALGLGVAERRCPASASASAPGDSPGNSSGGGARAVTHRLSTYILDSPLKEHPAVKIRGATAWSSPAPRALRKGVLAFFAVINCTHFYQ